MITKIKVCWNIQDFINLDYKTLGGYGSNNYIQYSQDPYKHIINNDVYSYKLDVLNPTLYNQTDFKNDPGHKRSG